MDNFEAKLNAIQTRIDNAENATKKAHWETMFESLLLGDSTHNAAEPDTVTKATTGAETARTGKKTEIEAAIAHRNTHLQGKIDSLAEQLLDAFTIQTKDGKVEKQQQINIDVVRQLAWAVSNNLKGQLFRARSDADVKFQVKAEMEPTYGWHAGEFVNLDSDIESDITREEQQYREACQRAEDMEIVLLAFMRMEELIYDTLLKDNPNYRLPNRTAFEEMDLSVSKYDEWLDGKMYPQCRLRPAQKDFIRTNMGWLDSQYKSSIFNPESSVESDGNEVTNISDIFVEGLNTDLQAS